MTSIYNGPTLYQAHYKNGTASDEHNMHKATYEEVERTVINKQDPAKNLVINIAQDYTKEKPYLNNQAFFLDDSNNYIVRIAEGKELAKNGKYNNNQMPIDGVEEVYRYYCDVLPSTQLDYEPEKTGEYYSRAYYNVADVVTDEDGCKWICIQSSTFGFLNAPKESEHSYFISFDAKRVGNNLENIPATKELAAQILFDLCILHHSKIPQNLENISSKASVEVEDLFATRDSMHMYPGETESKGVPINFSSVLYREKNKLYVLRIVGDYTHQQPNGVRDFMYRFYDSYTKDLDRKMALSDLANASIISQYNDDEWVYLPWYDTETEVKNWENIGPRTTTENVDDLTRFIYKKGQVLPTNIYREPILAFAVTRVKDLGWRSTKFENGIRIKLPQDELMSEIYEGKNSDDWFVTQLMVSSYIGVRDNSILLNGKKWLYGFDNKVK